MCFAFKSKWRDGWVCRDIMCRLIVQLRTCVSARRFCRIYSAAFEFSWRGSINISHQNSNSSHSCLCQNLVGFQRSHHVKERKALYNEGMQRH